MNIFVGNLNYNLSETELKGVFEEFGEVTSVKIIKDRETGRGKGYGFVEMPNDSEANNAISALDGKEIKGRSARVSVAKPRE
ncbi:MAG: RNA-binding protein [Bacteroidales bacterium]|nr:RNA-binding protein [Bacteroidales bacterium]